MKTYFYQCGNTLKVENSKTTPAKCPKCGKKRLNKVVFVCDCGVVINTDIWAGVKYRLCPECRRKFRIEYNRKFAGNNYYKKRKAGKVIKLPEIKTEEHDTEGQALDVVFQEIRKKYQL